MENIKETKKQLIKSIEKAVFKSRDDKAVAQFKYDKLNYRNNVVQISVIVFSTLITFIETVKATYEINEYATLLIPIMCSTYIALVVAIIRFLKYDEKRENLAKIIERFSFIINKYKRTKHNIKYFRHTEKNIDEWNKLLNIFHTETYEYMNETRRMFDNAVTFKEKIFYNEKLKKLHIDDMFNDRDFNNISVNKLSNHRQYVRNKKIKDYFYEQKEKKNYNYILNKYDDQLKIDSDNTNTKVNINSVSVV